METKQRKSRRGKGMTTKFKVTNICAVQNCGFPINLQKLWKSPECSQVYDECNIYTVIKPKGTDAHITVFYNGNMICVGNKKISQAKRNLELTKKFLRKFKSTKSFLLLKSKLKKGEKSHHIYRRLGIMPKFIYENRKKTNKL